MNTTFVVRNNTTCILRESIFLLHFFGQRSKIKLREIRQRQNWVEPLLTKNAIEKLGERDLGGQTLDIFSSFLI